MKPGEYRWNPKTSPTGPVVVPVSIPQQVMNVYRNGIFMAFGKGGEAGSHAIFDRIIGETRGAEFAKLCTATIRAVAQGVIGVAFIQAIIVGLCLLNSGVPWILRRNPSAPRPVAADYCEFRIASLSGRLMTYS